MSENPVRRKFFRHIDIKQHFVRELVLDKILKLVPLRTHKTVADALTKSLLSPASVGHRRQIMNGHVPFCHSPPKLLRGLILSADFERCVFHIFRLIVYIFFSPSTLRLVGLSCV